MRRSAALAGFEESCRMQTRKSRSHVVAPSSPAAAASDDSLGSGRRMDWRQLEYFRVAGRLQHVTRAAERLGTSQPALSRTLARLEADLGVPLFDRIGRSIRLTRYGELFLRRVESALGQIDEGRLELADLARPDRGTVALGFLRSLGAKYVPQIVRRFSAAYADIRFTFTPNNSAALEEQLERGVLDLAFTTVPVAGPMLASTRVTDQELVLIVPRSHRLAHRRQVTLREVANEPFVTFKRGHAFRRLTEGLCQEAGFVPSITFEGDDSSSVPGFVAAGFGVAIASPESGSFGGVVGLRISAPSARRAIGIAWAKDRYLPAGARTFRDFVTASDSPRRR
jgi:DNA-binding transcriptional LysR family regulator